MTVKTGITRLFLYGSLLTGTPDRRIDTRIRRLLRHSTPAMIRARLYNLGHYPGVILSTAKTDRVYGRVITFDDSLLLRRLDRYEGYDANDPASGEFIRILKHAELLPTRNCIDCWVYVYNGDVSGWPRILSGDYVQYRKARRKWSGASTDTGLSSCLFERELYS